MVLTAPCSADCRAKGGEEGASHPPPPPGPWDGGSRQDAAPLPAPAHLYEGADEGEEHPDGPAEVAHDAGAHHAGAQGVGGHPCRATPSAPHRGAWLGPRGPWHGQGPAPAPSPTSGARIPSLPSHREQPQARHQSGNASVPQHRDHPRGCGHPWPGLSHPRGTWGSQGVSVRAETPQPHCAAPVSRHNSTGWLGRADSPGVQPSPGAAWHGTAWLSGVQPGIVWHGTAPRGMAWHGTAQHGMVWLGMAQHGMAWHGKAQCGTA